MKSVCDNKNFEYLFNEHFKHVRNFMYYKSGDLSLSEDLAQESFTILWKKCATVQFEAAKSYLFTVSGRLFLNKKKREKIELNFIKKTGSSSNKETPEFLMEENEFKKTLESAIAELPSKQREVFLMNRIDGMPFREIAESLEISVKAVEKRMSLCLQALKEKMEILNTRKI